MRRTYGSCRAIPASPTVLLAMLFLSLDLSGCNNTCVVFISDPGGTISGNTPTCSLNEAKGNIRVRITSSLALPANGESARIEHIYVTLRGIEANPNAIADDDSPNWQELAPKLARQPAQLDLLARSGDTRELDTPEYVAIPADAYRQIRLRLSPNKANAGESVPEENFCGSVGLNCVVTSEGSIQPLVLASKDSQIEISPGHIAGGFFRLLPETTVNLEIEFNPQSSVFISAGEAVRLLPVFAVEWQVSDGPVADTDPVADRDSLSEDVLHFVKEGRVPLDRPVLDLQ
jgi:hypothetical protein